MEPETELILENIRKIRREKKISVLKLSLEIGISHSHLFYIESKRISPSIDVVIKIAKALNIQFCELIEDHSEN
jgi:transcriptional regulator with XRE-family HTH domain